MKHMLIFGLGYTAGRLADALKARGWAVDATGSAGNIAFNDEHAVRAALREASHLVSSVPPDRQTGDDPVLARYGEALSSRWIGYLSSTGVYGDQHGAWVDESTPTVSGASKGRRNARADADAKWMQLGARVFRLPGIYGPERSALDRVREGKARRIDIPGQV
ncbi:MAG: SDR family NAD(P)-dependent oxidoreductase, partial [Altererythrobacter sp.]|nr:SDR family NAD(P)-dependent oxidoreductase [Altererythrobacter sp.]